MEIKSRYKRNWIMLIQYFNKWRRYTKECCDIKSKILIQILFCIAGREESDNDNKRVASSGTHSFISKPLCNTYFLLNSPLSQTHICDGFQCIKIITHQIRLQITYHVENGHLLARFFLNFLMEIYTLAGNVYL